MALLLGDIDLHLLGEGNHRRLWEILGAHVADTGDPGAGVRFSVWAPNARSVSVVGDWNGWRDSEDRLEPQGRSGVWAGIVRQARAGQCYKFAVTARSGVTTWKADPLARRTQCPPDQASIVEGPSAMQWGDDADERAERCGRVTAPLRAYEVHLGSWKLGLGYRDAAEQLADHCEYLGFTHVELLPVSEHPYTPSWGYQVSGYYAPTARFGAPDDFRAFVDILHRRGIGVILDWVPAHFPKDAWALARFDGTALYEHEDPRQGEHPDWGTHVFNYGRNEVSNFLIANALYWLEEFHIDGLRVDAVAPMLYLDYSRQPGEWVPNRFGGRENLEAIEFLKHLNSVVVGRFPGVMMIAEESTSWPKVTAPPHHGGLGFTHKWNMGWMHDTLQYVAHDPVHRRWHHRDLTFGLLYAFSERFVLPLSHDEVVHGKGSLLRKMAGDDWQKFAGLRALLAWMWAYPGGKLLFMGSEMAPWEEWSEERGLPWHLLDHAPHRGVFDTVTELNRVAAGWPATWEQDDVPGGFQWLDADDADHSCFGFLRWARSGREAVVCVSNFTPVPRSNHRIGVPHQGRWDVLIDTDTTDWWGSGFRSLQGTASASIEASDVAWQGQPHSIVVDLPALGDGPDRRPLVTADAIVLHGHAYQPPRADPRTGQVPVEPSAHPFHDWNERITAECYRPNAFARIYDDHGRIVRIVNNYERMSFDLGPTLARWLEVHDREVHDRFVEGDRAGHTAVAHPFHHAILPLAPIEDARTELLWGIADFVHRFGRHPEGMWFPETAIDERVAALLPELGIGFTIVAPYQVTPMVPPGTIGRWTAPDGSTLDLVSYDGAVSHDLAFGSLLADTTALVERLAGSAPSGLVAAATDAETFGHHHRFTERGVAHALFHVVEAAGLRTGGLAPLIGSLARTVVDGIPPSAWSCAHGLGRWERDCGCSTDGAAGWHGRWRAPLRSALRLLRDHAVEVFRRRGATVFHDPMAARDAYGTVLADPTTWESFVHEHVLAGADERLASLLLESQEATLASFTSCAWFFADIARREVVIVLQEAARSAELLASIGETPPLDEALAILATAAGNRTDVADGREVWRHAMEGDGTLPHERRPESTVPSFPAPSSLSPLLMELIDDAIGGDDERARQAIDLIDVSARSGTLLPLERAQERLWAERGETGWPERLVGLASMLGFATGA